MVRRVGFGNTDDGDRDEPLKPPDVGEHPPEGVSGEAPPPRPPSSTAVMNSWTRFIVAGFIGLWLAGWTYGIWFAFEAIGDIWNRTGDGIDWIGLGFMALWLFFALIGWAFGVVIIVVLLFGKPITPERRAEKEARRAARRAEREARRNR